MGIFTQNKIGIRGMVLIMLAHGLCSSALFFLVGSLYTSSKSRRIFLNKGLIALCPPAALFWFILCVTNIGLPPTLNFARELLVTTSVIHLWNPWLLPLALTLLLAGTYSLYLLKLSFHGKPSPTLPQQMRITQRRLLVATRHWLPLLLLITNFEIFLYM